MNAQSLKAHTLRSYLTQLGRTSSYTFFPKAFLSLFILPFLYSLLSRPPASLIPFPPYRRQQPLLRAYL